MTQHDGNGTSSERGQQGGLRWRDLGVSMKGRSQRGGKKYLLHPSSGFVKNGRLCGIIGPSGSGKSTLLGAISGTTLKGAGKHLTGTVWLDEDLPIDCDGTTEKSYLSTSNGEVAILQQHDAFFSMLTPRETIQLAAYLQLSAGKGDLNQIVDRILDSLGLREVENSTIGDGAWGGDGAGGCGGSFLVGGCLSGGERRRLSVALELVTSPKVFLADEATTGLDSAQAEKVVNIIVKLGKELNIPCICSLHQPRASIWKALDSFILVAPGGMICYMGAPKDATKYFSALGFECPLETNPAEYFIDLVTIDTEDPKRGAVDRERIQQISNAFSEYNKNSLSSDEDSSTWTPPNSGSKRVKKMRLGRRNFFLRLNALFWRAWKQNIRDYRINLVRLAASVGLAGLFSELFKSVKEGKSIPRSIADRTALLSFGAINMSMLAVMKTLNLFGKEKKVVMRERMRRQYSSFEYLLSKTMAEMPLDAAFSAVFAAALKYMTGLQIPLERLTETFCLMTITGASLGFAIGSITSNAEEAMALGMPTMVILMAVGIINPSGVSPDDPPPLIIRYLKQASPIKWAIEALCVAEYKGLQFGEGGRKRWGQRLQDLPRMGALAMVQNGDQVLDALGLGNKSYNDLTKGLIMLTGVNLLLSWIGLSWFGPNFIEATTNQLPERVSIVSKEVKTQKSAPRLKTSKIQPLMVNSIKGI